MKRRSFLFGLAASPLMLLAKSGNARIAAVAEDPLLDAVDTSDGNEIYGQSPATVAMADLHAKNLEYWLRRITDRRKLPYRVDCSFQYMYSTCIIVYFSMLATRTHGYEWADLLEDREYDERYAEKVVDRAERAFKRALK